MFCPQAGGRQRQPAARQIASERRAEPSRGPCSPRAAPSRAVFSTVTVSIQPSAAAPRRATRVSVSEWSRGAAASESVSPALEEELVVIVPLTCGYVARRVALGSS